MNSAEEVDLPLSQESFQELWEDIRLGGINELIPDLPRTDSDAWLKATFRDGAPLEALCGLEPAVNTDATAGTSDNLPPPASVVPSITDYPGEYDLQLHFNQSSTTKSVTSTYSPVLNKLYCQIAKTCPMDVLVGRNPPLGAVLRATAVYKKPEHVSEVVVRCPHHQIIAEATDGVSPPHHLICSEGNPRAMYEEHHLTKRHSVVQPYEAPQPGSHATTVLLSFMCNSSCQGGMNRRPILTVVTLETFDGQVLGRRCFEVRVCACPGRDRTTEEGSCQVKDEQVTRSKRKYPFKEKLQISQSSDDIYILQVRGKENFEILSKINASLELLEVIPENVQDTYKKKRNKRCTQNQPKNGKKLLLTSDSS